MFIIGFRGWYHLHDLKSKEGLLDLIKSPGIRSPGAWGWWGNMGCIGSPCAEGDERTWTSKKRGRRRQVNAGGGRWGETFAAMFNILYEHLRQYSTYLYEHLRQCLTYHTNIYGNIQHNIRTFAAMFNMIYKHLQQCYLNILKPYFEPPAPDVTLAG